MGKDLQGNDIGRGYTQCKNGRYKYSFRLESGKQTAVYGRSVADCKKNYKKALEEYRSGITASNKAITYGAYFDEWLKNLIHDGLKGSSAHLYTTQNKNHIKPVFGTTKLVSVTTNMARKFQRDLEAKGLNPSTVNCIVNLAHHVFEDAVRDEIIQKNPFSVLKNLSKEKDEDGDLIVRDNNRALTAEETKWFLDAMKDSFYYNAARLLFATGMRSGELRGLKWSDYDKKNNVLHIRRTASVDSGNSLCMNSPKTKHSKRDIPLNDEIIEIIEDHKENMRKTQGNVVPMDGYMFTSVRGLVVSRNVLKSAFFNACERVRKAGHPEFKNISPHCARHTFITDMLNSGENIYAVKAIVGHSPTASVTEGVYLDRSQEAMNKAMQNRKAI